tara:strand:- start:759 stop:1568 length:810 start_codon:yes stop_codon:yes gene_type:complete
MKITASIVIYNDEPKIFERAILSFLNACNGDIFIIDNSEHDIQSKYFGHSRVKYFKTNKNLGFGKGHNFALNKIRHNSDLHFFINPDIYFDGVINEIASIFKKNKDFGVLMPKILYPDGSIQDLCKLLPTPMDLILRRFIKIPFLRKIFHTNYVLKNIDESTFSEIPSLSGCFLAAPTMLLKNIGGFDERYFLYMEDIDLVRRIGKEFKTIYYPNLEVIHEYKKGSYTNKKLLMLHIKSAIAYFNKHGWIFDKYRSSKNKEVLSKIVKK